MRPAAQILLVEAAELPPIFSGRNRRDFDRPTVLDGWSVRDVIAHCSATLGRIATGDIHGFTPADNAADVAARRDLTIPELIEELVNGYEEGARAVDGAEGAYDGVGLGEWIHGGDIRDGLGAREAYTSQGVDMAIELLAERSRLGFRGRLDVDVAGRRFVFGGGEETSGTLVADAETFVRLCGGRRPDQDRFRIVGASPADVVLFR